MDDSCCSCRGNWAHPGAFSGTRRPWPPCQPQGQTFTLILIVTVGIADLFAGAKSPSAAFYALNGHTGWVRSVATYRNWLFSCGCNYLKQWDTSYPVPKQINDIKLFTGDLRIVAHVSVLCFASPLVFNAAALYSKGVYP